MSERTKIIASLLVGVAYWHFAINGGSLPTIPGIPAIIEPALPATPPDDLAGFAQWHAVKAGATQNEAEAVGDNFQLVAKEIANASEIVPPEGERIIATTDNAFERLRRLNGDTLGNRLQAWQPALEAIDAKATAEKKSDSVFEVGEQMKVIGQALGGK